MTAGHDDNHEHVHHDHHHEHEHEQHLTGPGTTEQAFGGPVTVDVGDGAGALVLVLDARWLGHEVHVRPTDGSGPATHTGVWPRRLPSGEVIAAVFGSLPAGSYTVLDQDGVTPLTEVEVPDGAVREVDLGARRRLAALR